MLRRVLVANRGEIALRVMRTARRLGIETVAVYSEADASAPHVRFADRALGIGPAPAAQSYLNAEAVLAAAAQSGADAVHPGYGFLSENAEFAEAVAAAGLRFVGPSPQAIRAMGLKDAARRLAAEAGAPVIPGYDGEDQDDRRLLAEAERIGWPVMIKARAGGGGKGMRAVERAADFGAALQSARAEAEAAFGDGAVLIEKRIAAPRHIEVQVFGDDHGGLVHLFERDCSLQRRHQKVIEEAPAPGVGAKMRAALAEAALAVARSVAYSGAGTVEFIADASAGLSAERFYFLEMNTRLQVEHPVTEAVTGLDLVEWQLRVAAGEPLPLTQEEIRLEGWAVEARLYAEDPAKDFAPSVGGVALMDFDPDLRLDAGVEAGGAVTPYYDPMIAKAIAQGPGRREAFARLAAGLERSAIAGVTTNLAFLTRLLRHPPVLAGAVETGLIARDLDALTAQGAPGLETQALAAVAALGLAEPASGADPWEALQGFRSWGRAAREVALIGPEGARAVTVEVLGPGRFAARSEAGETALELVSEAPGRLRLQTASGSRRARVSLEETAEGRVVHIAVEGEPPARYALPSARADGAAAGGAGDAALAPMPGLVKAVLVSLGEAVTSGQAVAEMEAMKMAITLRAPRDGVVAAIGAAAGDQVAEGAVLMRLEPLE